MAVVTKTLKPSGGDYTSIVTWESTEQTDLVTDTDTHVLNPYKGDYSGVGGGVNYISENVSVAGWTTGVSNFITITVPSTERHDGTPQTGFHIIKSRAFAELFTNSMGYTVVEYLDIENTNANGECIDRTGANTNYQGVILKAGANKECIISVDASSVVRNSLAWGGSVGFRSRAFTDGTILNSAAANCTTGFTSGGGTNGVVANCVAWGSTTSYGGSWHATNSKNNAADDGSTTTPPGANPITTDIVSGDFVDQANDDYHITTGSTLKDAGADLSGTFTDDIDDDTRSGTFDVGIDEFISAGVTVPVGSILLTEQTPVFTRTENRAFNPSNNILTLTGQTPQYVIDQRILIPVGTVTLTTQTPTSTVSVTGISIEVPVGSIVLTEQTPALTRTQNVLIEVPQGTITLITQTPSGVVSQDIGVGSILLTTQTPTLTVTQDKTFIIPVGSVTLTGEIPEKNPSFIVGEGGITLTAQTPTITVEDLWFTASAGTGTWTAQSAGSGAWTIQSAGSGSWH